MSTRPNFLIISAHQHRADCLGVAGRKVKTPHLDSLAKSGTRFSSCITPSIACQPARASILTGQLCKTHGVHDDGLDLDPNMAKKALLEHWLTKVTTPHCLARLTFPPITRARLAVHPSALSLQPSGKVAERPLHGF